MSQAGRETLKFGIALGVVLILLAFQEKWDKKEAQIKCLELNLGKETCDKIFNEKGE